MSHAQQQSGYDITRRDKTSVRQFSKLQRRPSEEKPGGEKKTVICPFVFCVKSHSFPTWSLCSAAPAAGLVRFVLLVFIIGHFIETGPTLLQNDSR